MCWTTREKAQKYIDTNCAKWGYSCGTVACAPSFSADTGCEAIGEVQDPEEGPSDRALYCGDMERTKDYFERLQSERLNHASWTDIGHYDGDQKDLDFSTAVKLKSTRTGISQGTGYIIKDGIKKEGSAIELKSDVVEMLGYPKELVSRNPSIVYRYTVYTPQEEMKLILSDDKEARLDTLRKVFGIDRYKRIRENAGLYAKEMRERISRLEGKAEGMEGKRKLMNGKEEEVRGIGLKIKELVPKLDKAGKEVMKARQEIEELERSMRKLNELRKEFEVNDTMLREKVMQRQKDTSEMEELGMQIEQLRMRLKEGVEDTGKQAVQKKNEISLMEKTMQELQKKVNEFEIMIRSSEEVKGNIGKLDKCPTCEQEVGSSHKTSITRREDEKISKSKEGLALHSEQHRGAGNRLEALKKELEELQQKEKKAEMQKVWLENLNEKERRRKMLQFNCDKLKQEIGRINMRKSEIAKGMEEHGDAEKAYSAVKDRLQAAEREQKAIEISIAGLSRESVVIEKSIDELANELDVMKQAKEQVKSLSMVKEWLSEHFANLMGVMERSVMMKVYGSFNELFVNWFNTLVEDETISVRLDDEFSPVVEQNGYETEIGNLSGGEKTSCALAYRLSLNKVVNELIDVIKTKDIIMLDEPTDGFSNEQLDKIRDVLDELKVRQIIIVSHDPKIESYVDNVIRISKREHESTVA